MSLYIKKHIVKPSSHSKYQIKSKLSEKQIEIDVSRFIGWTTPIGSIPIKLLDVNENVTGADMKYDCVIPLYMQFKVSEGLHSASTIIPSSRKNRSILEDIREFRLQEDLEDSPTLYFKLRAKAKNALDFQHNILMQLSNTGFSRAFYVAPLTLDNKDYETGLFTSSRYLSNPFRYSAYHIHQRDWVSYFASVPFLRMHISLSPHERVDTEEHFYSFSTNATDIAWHSPLIIDRYPSRLSDLLYSIISEAFVSKERWSDINYINTDLRRLQIDLDEDEIEGNDSPLNRIQTFGRALLNKYGIRQMLLLSSFGDIDKYQSNNRE